MEEPRNEGKGEVGRKGDAKADKEIGRWRDARLTEIF